MALILQATSSRAFIASYWPQVLRIDEHRTTEATLFSRRLAHRRSADDQTLSGKYSNWGKGTVMRYTVWTRVSDIDTWRDHRLNNTFLTAYLKSKHFCAITYICPGIGKKRFHGDSCLGNLMIHLWFLTPLVWVLRVNERFHKFKQKDSEPLQQIIVTAIHDL